jgi:hypothetical protein
MTEGLTTLNSYGDPAERAPVVAACKRLASELVALLRSEEVDPFLRREVKNLMARLCWSVTEIDASRYKYDQRFISAGVKERMEQSGCVLRGASTRGLRHEHVFQKKLLVADLMDASNADEVVAILDRAVACVVTDEEHRSLPDNLDGWQRYRAAGLAVWDRAEGRWLDFESVSLEPRG